MDSFPQSIGKYQILDPIASGGMAEVYRAKAAGAAGFEKVVALKRIRPRHAKQERFIKNFNDEARIALTLHHRNIVQVIDFGRDGDELFLAMEFVEGIDLRAAVRRSEETSVRLPEALVAYVLSEVAKGLDYAHRKTGSDGIPLSIVHCDVSPHNVLLGYEGEVKISDFGVARARFIAAPTTRRLRGKPRYMSPEQTEGKTPSAASDVFVLGILAWELFAGTQLFGGKEIKAVLKEVREKPIPSLARLRPELPRHLVKGVHRALNRDIDSRGSASDLGVLLQDTARALSTRSGTRQLQAWLLNNFPQDIEGTETVISIPQFQPEDPRDEDEETMETMVLASTPSANSSFQSDPDTAVADIADTFPAPADPPTIVED